MQMMMRMIYDEPHMQTMMMIYDEPHMQMMIMIYDDDMCTLEIPLMIHDDDICTLEYLRWYPTLIFVFRNLAIRYSLIDYKRVIKSCALNR